MFFLESLFAASEIAFNSDGLSIFTQPEELLAEADGEGLIGKTTGDGGFNASSDGPALYTPMHVA